MGKKQTTVRVGGKRVIVTTNAAGKTTVKAALPEEHELQAAQVKRLRGMPEYARTASEAGPGKFNLAGDMNAGRRGPKARTQALKAGLTAGEHDVRIYMWPGMLGLIENKVGKAPLEPSQERRHPLLHALGFTRQVVIRAVTEDEAADKAEAAVREWLLEAANDNTASSLPSAA